MTANLSAPSVAAITELNEFEVAAVHSARWRYERVQDGNASVWRRGVQACSSYGQLRLPTCVFMDSDERGYDGDKKALHSEGIQVFDWDEGMSTEL